MREIGHLFIRIIEKNLSQFMKFMKFPYHNLKNIYIFWKLKTFNYLKTVSLTEIELTF